MAKYTNIKELFEECMDDPRWEHPKGLERSDELKMLLDNVKRGSNAFKKIREDKEHAENRKFLCLITAATLFGELLYSYHKKK